MRDDLPALLPLVCPRCRRRSARGREMSTLSIGERFLSAPAAGDEDGAGDEIEAGAAPGRGEVIEGTLVCDDPACRQRYPIVDGVPLIVSDLAAFLRSEAAALVEGELSPEIQALLADAGPDDAPLARLLEHLSIYLDAHWGDRASPPPDGPGDSFGLRALAGRLAARAVDAPVERAVDLGCSVGRGVAELARGARIVVGVDLHAGAVRRARRLLGGAPLAYARRVVGRAYRPALAQAADLTARRAALLCADALDPPLVPGGFDRVAALNVLDSVPDPAQLLSVADGLLAPGGELLLSCPYAFQSGIVDEERRFGGNDPARWLRARLEAGHELESSYAVEEEAELPWSLRRDARSAQVYAVHFLRARKASA